MTRTQKPGKPLRLSSSYKRALPLSDSSLQIYLRQVGRAPLLSAKEEIDLATEILVLRKAVWREIWSDHVAAELVVQAVLPSAKEDDRPALVALADVSAAFRTHPRRSARAPYDAAVERVLALPYFDEDLALGTKVASDLERLGRGEETTFLVRRLVNETCSARVEVALRAKAKLLTYRRVFDRFVRANLRLVVACAQRFSWTAVPFLDLVQDGNLGLLRAVTRFDPTRGLRFSTYATWWIRHTIHRALDETEAAIRVPTHRAAALRKLSVVEARLEQSLGRKPELHEIAQAAGVPEKEAAFLAKIQSRVMSLDVENEIGLSRATDVPDPHPSPEDELDAQAFERTMDRALDELGPRLSAIVVDRFGLAGPKKHLAEVAREQECSREWIRQQQIAALRRIREHFEMTYAAPYDDRSSALAS